MTMDPGPYAAIYGPTTGDRIRLADTGLTVQVTADDSLRGDEFLLGFGKTGRDGMHMAALPPSQTCDLVISNVLVLDPLLGVARPQSASAAAGWLRSAGPATRTRWQKWRWWWARAPR